jgi:hypothetical protein
MRTVDDLRTALDDADTPGGIDVAAVRRRAGQQRRTALAAVAVAAAVVAAVAVPTALLGGHRAGPAPRPATPPAVAVADCPNRFPAAIHNSGPGLADRLAPFTVEGALICQYRLDQTMNPDGSRAHYGPLTASQAVPAATARALVAHLDARTPGLSTGCGASGPSVVLQVLGPGRTVSLGLTVSRCLYVTNGVLEKLAMAAGQEWLDLLSTTPARLSCPDRMPTELDVRGPTDRFVPFRPDLLIICRYLQPDRGGKAQPPDVREVDGPAAAALVRQLDALSTQVMRCPLLPGPHYSYLMEVVGAPGRAILTGGDYGCSTLFNGRRLGFGVNWPALLTG